MPRTKRSDHLILASKVAPEAAHGLDAALAFGFVAGEVGAGLWVDPAGVVLLVE
jgi:hypothetical protein